MFSQIRQTPRNSPDRKYAIAPSISGLMRLRCPAAIMQAVILAVINSFKLPATLTFAHVFKKILECVPFQAIPNTPSAVIFPISSLGIITSLSHARPHSVNAAWAFVFAVNAITVRFAKLSGGFFLKTSARFGVSGTQRRIPSDNHTPTITNANTHGNTFSCWRYSERRLGRYFKSSKPKTDNVYFSRHNGDCFTVLFSSGAQHAMLSAAAIVSTLNAGINA